MISDHDNKAEKSITHQKRDKNFTVLGPVYPIIEKDLLSVIESRLLKLQKKRKWRLLEQSLRERIIKQLKHPSPIQNLLPSNRSQCGFFDPTWVLHQDIRDHTGKLIARAGTVVNPLKTIRLRQLLIFIDGVDKKSVNWAVSLYKKQHGQAKLILVRGSPISLMEQINMPTARGFSKRRRRASRRNVYQIHEDGELRQFNREGNKQSKTSFIPVYFDQNSILVNHFHLKHVPVFVRQKGLKLEICEVKL
jgi:type-F conjugative transfer system protein TraW